MLVRRCGDVSFMGSPTTTSLPPGLPPFRFSLSAPNQGLISPNEALLRGNPGGVVEKGVVEEPMKVGFGIVAFFMSTSTIQTTRDEVRNGIDCYLMKMWHVLS